MPEETCQTSFMHTAEGELIWTRMFNIVFLFLECCAFAFSKSEEHMSPMLQVLQKWRAVFDSWFSSKSCWQYWLCNSLKMSLRMFSISVMGNFLLGMSRKRWPRRLQDIKLRDLWYLDVKGIPKSGRWDRPVFNNKEQHLALSSLS